MPFVPSSRINRIALAFALALTAADAAHAQSGLTGSELDILDMQECSCRHIEDLQQEYRNAAYMAEYMQDFARNMERDEQPRDGQVRSDDDLNRQMRLYPGDNPVEPPFGRPPPGDGLLPAGMTAGSCDVNSSLLFEALAKAPCKAIAEAIYERSRQAAQICSSMGAAQYWSRPPSERIWEQAGHYQVKRDMIKEELRRVLDEAEITYRAQWEIGINIGGMAQYGYSYSATSEDIGGASGGDPWTMTGQGKSTVAWTKAVIAGMQCTATGQVNTTYEAKMTTDGLTFDLEISEISSSGALGLRCPGGGGGGPVAAGGGTGEIASGLAVRAGVIPIPVDMGSEMRAILAGTGTVESGGSSSVSIVCTGP